MTEKEKRRIKHQLHREKDNAKSREYHNKHREEQNAISRKYHQEHKEIQNAKAREYYKEHHEELLRKKKEYREKNKLLLKQKRIEYLATQRGRANNILSQYRRSDKRLGYECVLTPEYIETEIFTKSCIYCGESDWRKLGCDRIDNNLPHIPENIVCSCWGCNDDRNKKQMSVEEYKEYKKRGSQ